MKRLLLLSLIVCSVMQVQAQDLKNIQLPAPNTKRGLPVMTALEKRQSTREFAARNLELQDLSDLIWAAVGVNRQNQGKRTAPTALNRQEIDLYVIMPDGAYLYEAKKHVLIPVAQGDFRSVVAGGQDFVKAASVSLVLVADIDKFNGEITMPAVDAGIASQNISLCCAGIGLVTVPRATMDHAQLKKVLKLRDGQRPLMNHPVGYAK